MVPLLELPQGGEWIVILVIVVLLFGAKKLPELTRNTARAMKEFEKARKGEEDETPQVTDTATGTVSGPAGTKSADLDGSRPEGSGDAGGGLGQPGQDRTS